VEHGVRYRLDRKLKGSDLKEYAMRRPICQVCGERLARLAFRTFEAPYPWIPVGWWCEDCCMADFVW